MTFISQKKLLTIAIIHKVNCFKNIVKFVFGSVLFLFIHFIYCITKYFAKVLLKNGITF